MHLAAPHIWQSRCRWAGQRPPTGNFAPPAFAGFALYRLERRRDYTNVIQGVNTANLILWSSTVSSRRPRLSRSSTLDSP